MKRGAVLNVFREPTGEIPWWINVTPKQLLRLRHPVTDQAHISIEVVHAETLLRVLLDICPNAQNAVDDWLARERPIIFSGPIERRDC